MPQPNKTQEQLARNSGHFSFEEISKFVRIIQNALTKQNLQGPGLEIKIASCAKWRGHGDAFSYLVLSCSCFITAGLVVGANRLFVVIENYNFY